AHVAQLWSREVGVEVQDARAHLRRSERDVDEPAVVSAENPDARALGDPTRTERTRQRVRALVELGERQRSELVHQPDAVPVADARNRDRSAELPELVDRAQHADDVLWRIAADHPRAPGLYNRAGLEHPAAPEVGGLRYQR